MRHGGLPKAAWRLLTASAMGVWAGLAVFHAWLFWVQWHDGRLSDPVIAAKWAGSLLLLGALGMLHRSGRALFFGRPALVVWTLVALVHVGASQPATIAPEVSSPSAGILFVVPGIAGALLAAGAALIAGARRARRRIPGARPLRTRALRSARCSPLALTGPHGLRAPPLAIA